ncbi:MAG: hypothetical protein D6763_00470 [Alphaproteobacteria bacterium]|nr:MAG: hypothetical protein D6763_00470 [Alphaproteobacteria bacterium]
MFERFVAIDWSGAKGKHLPGLAIAIADAGQAAPCLVAPPRGNAWSRQEVVAFIEDQVRQGGVLIGMDFSFSLPFMDAGRYFPFGSPKVDNARDIWRLVERVCAGDDHLYARHFVEADRFAPLFRWPGHLGGAYKPRLRVTEARCRDAGFGPAESVYNLIGPAQVGLASLSGMRLLARLCERLRSLVVWPFATPATGQSCLVEMYSRLFLKRAGIHGVKVRTPDQLKAALDALGSAPFRGEDASALSDHETDVLVSAAGLRNLVAGGDPAIWKPPGLSDKVRLTEGWTFGVV